MRRSLTAVLIAAFAALSAPVEGTAQSIFVGGIATVPTGDFADFGAGDGANVGWQGEAGVLFPVGAAGVLVGARGFYGSNSHDTEGDKTNLYGAMGIVEYDFPTGGSVSPFIFGEFGYMTHSYKSEDFPDLEGSESGPAFGLGAGLDVPVGGVNAYVGGSYHQGMSDIDGTTYIGIFAGLSFALGGGM